MSNFLSALRESVRSGFCGFISQADDRASFINELTPGAEIPNVGAFWNRAICDSDGPTPLPPPNFDGGQCPGSRYRVAVTYDRPDSIDCAIEPVTAGPTFVGVGPISGGFLVVGSDDGISRSNGVRFIDGLGTVRDIPNTTVATECPDISVLNIDITPIGSDPDNCGNPGPFVSPYPSGGKDVPISVTYVNNEGDNVTELGDLRIFAPVVIAPVNIVAPVRVDLGGVEFSGNITLSPEFDISFSPDGVTGGAGSEGDEDSEPDEDDPTLIGVLVRSQNAVNSGATVVFGSGGNPDLFVPRLATVGFRVKTAAGSVAFQGAIDVKTEDAFVPAPLDAKVVGWFSVPIPGVTTRITPVYSSLEPRQ
jgi:hypothetical protein